jgi:hypothetical protein
LRAQENSSKFLRMKLSDCFPNWNPFANADGTLCSIRIAPQDNAGVRSRMKRQNEY